MHRLSLETSRRRARVLAHSILLAAGLLLMALAADAMVSVRAMAAPAQGRVTLSGSDVAIFNLAGTARLEAGTGSAVQVSIEPAGRDAGRLERETLDTRGRHTLVIRYPDNRIVYPALGRGSSTTVRVRDDGTFDGDRGRGWPGGRDQVRISGSGNGLEAHADLVVSVPQGQKLSFYLAAGDVTVENVNGTLRVDTGAGSVSTKSTRGALVVDTGSGDVNVGGAEGPVEIDTGSGDVNVARVKGDELSVDTGSGGIRALDIAVETLSCDTGSGEVELNGIDAREIVIDTGSGSVEVTMDGACDRLAVDTGSGDVTVRVPPGFGAELAFESGSGRVYADVPLTVREREHGMLRGRVGDGGGRLVVETGSGDLRIAENVRSRSTR